MTHPDPEKEISDIVWKCYHELAYTVGVAHKSFAKEEAWKYRAKMAEILALIQDDILGPLLARRPDLTPADWSDEQPEVPTANDELTADDLAVIATLAPEDIAHIDNLIVSFCVSHLRKQARIVLDVQNSRGEKLPELPYTFLSMRVADLVERGVLEAAGDLNYLRFSEVRLKQS